MSAEEAGLEYRHDLLVRTQRRLAGAGVGNAFQEARWLLEDVQELPDAESMSRLDALVERRMAGEPLQYVLGHWAFRGLDLLVDPRVLIPRPETEVVCDCALAEVDRILTSGTIAADKPVNVLDLGTGSGALGLAIAAERPSADIWAVDRSAGAVTVARSNAADLGFDARRVQVLEGSWFEPLPEALRGAVHVIASNPPYVAASDLLPAEVAEWEPLAALLPCAEAHGLEAIEVIVAGAPGWLCPGGALVIEIGEDQGSDVAGLAAGAGLVDVEIRPDLAGRPRALVAHRPG